MTKMRWSDKQVDRLIELKNGGLSWADIAADLAVDRKKCKGKWDNITNNYQKPEFENKPTAVDRNCLRCGRAFVADGRYNRLCGQAMCGSDHYWSING